MGLGASEASADARSSALIQGRFEAPDRTVQLVRPSEVMGELLGTILTVQSFVVACAVILGVATLATACLVFLLSLRLRAREILTLRKIGGATAYALAGLALEIVGYGGSEPASPAALTTIRVLTTAVPAFFLLAATALALGYPLTRARHAEILDALDQRQRATRNRATTGEASPG